MVTPFPLPNVTFRDVQPLPNATNRRRMPCADKEHSKDVCRFRWPLCLSFLGCIYFDNSTAGVLSFLSWSERHRILTLRPPTSNAAQGESCILYARGIRGGVYPSITKNSFRTGTLEYIMYPVKLILDLFRRVAISTDSNDVAFFATPHSPVPAVPPTCTPAWTIRTAIIQTL